MDGMKRIHPSAFDAIKNGPAGEGPREGESVAQPQADTADAEESSDAELTSTNPIGVDDAVDGADIADTGSRGDLGLTEKRAGTEPEAGGCGCGGCGCGAGEAQPE